VKTSLSVFVAATQISALVCGLAASCLGETAPAPERAYLVKITDVRRQSGFQAMTQAEVADLKKQNDLEQKLFPQALIQAEQEWKADKQNDKTPFPSTKFAPPHVTVMEQYPSREQAEKKVEVYVGRDLKKAKPDATAKVDSAKAAREEIADRACQLLQAKLADLVTKEKEKTAAKDAPAATEKAEKAE